MPGGLCPWAACNCVNDTYSWGNLSGCPFTGCVEWGGVLGFPGAAEQLHEPRRHGGDRYGLRRSPRLAAADDPGAQHHRRRDASPVRTSGSASASIPLRRGRQRLLVGTTAGVPFTAGSAWALDFSDGVVNATLKPATWYVRAVRTGQ